MYRLSPPVHDTIFSVHLLPARPGAGWCRCLYFKGTQRLVPRPVKGPGREKALRCRFLLSGTWHARCRRATSALWHKSGEPPLRKPAPTSCDQGRSSRLSILCYSPLDYRYETLLFYLVLQIKRDPSTLVFYLFKSSSSH